MENQVATPIRRNAVATPEPENEKGITGGLRSIGRRLANNVRLIDLYARGKDGYKIFEMMGPILGSILPSRLRGSNPRDNEELKNLYSSYNKHRSETVNYTNAYHDLIRDKMNLSADKKVDFAISKEIEQMDDVKSAKAQSEYSRSQRETFEEKYKAQEILLRPEYEYKTLKNNLIGDTLNFALQWGISKFSSMSEKDMVVRTYGTLARQELGIHNREIKFSDLKKVSNPIVREAVDYYSKKSLYRFLPDFTGLVRWVPLVAFAVSPKLKSENSLLSKALWTVAEKIDGIKLLLGSKTAYFAWYFTNRQTGSFYQVENLWNKTEGIANNSNRLVNQNTLTGDFVTRLEVARLYEEFRKENPDMKMEQFTPDDPLTNVVFEQMARYLNHSYMPKLFAVSEPKKQDDLPSKNFSHAMMVEIMGTGGIRVEDAIGSALRLEVMAFHGRAGIEAGINKYREVSKILDKSPHPTREQFATQEEAIEATHQYLRRIDEIGREYLGELWPPKYINEELKEGFIKTIFQNADLGQDKIDYISSALFMREQETVRTYRPSENDPASALLDTPHENKQEAAREAEHRKSFTDKIDRKRPEDIMQQQLADDATVGATQRL